MRRARDEGGQAIALFAVSLPLFLVLLLLVIDGGRMLIERERIRNAAQFAAEAVASMAGDASAQIPTSGQAGAMASAALTRNLPGEQYTSVVSLTPPAQGAPFRAAVRVEKTFASSIQRITFRIGATAAAQLGQSAASSAAPSSQPTATPYTPSCYRLTASHSRVAAYASQVSSSVITVTDVASGATAHDILYLRPASRVEWRVDTTLAWGGSHSIRNWVTLPGSGAFSTTADAGYSTVYLTATYGASAQCPQ